MRSFQRDSFQEASVVPFFSRRMFFYSLYITVCICKDRTTKCCSICYEMPSNSRNTHGVLNLNIFLPLIMAKVTIVWRFGAVTKATYPGYQSFFFACDEELRRPQADQSSAFGRRHERRSFSRGSLFKTWPRVKATRPFTIIPVMSGGRLFFSLGVNVLVKEKKSQFSSLFFL